MSNNNVGIRVENISKCYRIGIKQEMHDSFARAMIEFIKSPIKNYRKYRSLYRFDDIGPDKDNNDVSDIIWALQDISFEIKKGEVVGIIGRNGAGKSTLLKILSRITSPTSGNAEIHGRVSSLLEVGTGFHPELTGRENIYLNGAILGMKRDEIVKKFDEIVAFAEVDKFIDTPVKRYSSGMQVRLAFSVAAHLEPEILIVDEVLAVGDAEFQKKCLNKMEDVGQQGRTVLFVSHNMPTVARLCSRAILIEDGIVKADGSPSKIISTYLHSDMGTTAARNWPDLEKAPSSSIAVLHAVRVKTEDGHITDSMDIRKQFRIEMEYSILKSGHVLLPIFAFTNEVGESIFVTVEQDPVWRRRTRPKGLYTSTVWIPGNLLAEGIHYINCVLLELNSDEVQFSEHNVVSFIVVDSLDGDSARGDYSKNFRGVVRPMLKWATQYKESI